MGRSSKRWISRHLQDPYVKKARQEKYRSRAAYKLLQIQEKFHLIHGGDWVLDLGAAPGGWSQVAAAIVGEAGRVFAVDLLKMEPLPGVCLIHGDFTHPDTLKSLLGEPGFRKMDLLLSDMAPNTSGISMLDHERSVQLLQGVLCLMPDLLRAGGSIVLKTFQGRDFKKLIDQIGLEFGKAKVFKPKASRSESVETYLIGVNYRGIG